MKIAVVAFDTRGGVQPYVALSLGLQDAGHQVTMITTADFRDLVAGRGVTLAATSGDTEANVRTLTGAAELSARERTRLMRRQLQATLAQTTTEVLAAADGAEVVLAGIGGSLTGRPVAEKLGVPYVDAHLQPLGPPTSAFPGPLFPQVPAWLGDAGRRSSHRLTAAALRIMFGAASRQVRGVLDLPPRPRRRYGAAALYGFSPRVVPPPPEWGAERRVTGYWFLPAAKDWAPPPALTDFLAVGRPPVAIGFGSMSSRDPAALGDLVVGAVRRAGVRAVVLSGWGGLAGRDSDGVLVIGDAPHDWLYPRVAAVVHHGGAGTTGAAFRAGVPAVVVPFAVDQPFWASRVHALGAGPEPIPRRRLTEQNLADALRAATTDDSMIRRADTLGAAIRAENGVVEAVHYLESALARF